MSLRSLWALLVLLVLSLGKVSAAISLDETAGTNIVSTITTSQTAAGNLIMPIVVAILLIGGVLGLYRALARKGRIGT